MTGIPEKSLSRESKVNQLVKAIKEEDKDFFFLSSHLEVNYSKDGQTSIVCTQDIAEGTLLLSTPELDHESCGIKAHLPCLESVAKKMADKVFEEKLFFTSNVIPEFTPEEWEVFYRIYCLFVLTILSKKKKDLNTSLFENTPSQQLLAKYLESWPGNDKSFHECFPFCWSADDVDKKLEELDVKEQKTGDEIKNNVKVLDEIARNIFIPILEEEVLTKIPSYTAKKVVNTEALDDYDNHLIKVFKFVFANVESRAFGVDECAFVPFFDLVNGSPEFADVFNATEQFSYSKNKHQLLSMRDIKVGEQIIINYGELTHDELFMKYGFVWE